jgi:methylenetetrahydrofolate--tRNA-(uracil-5-)-methyltransferase
MGSVHRNTFVDAPRVLDERMQLRARRGVFLAGQITGVEGYVESCAGGFVCAVLLAHALLGRPLAPPPVTTALGGLLGHLSQASRPGGRSATYQPSNVTWAWLPPPPRSKRMDKRQRYEGMALRALADLDGWLEEERRAGPPDRRLAETVASSTTLPLELGPNAPSPG